MAPQTIASTLLSLLTTFYAVKCQYLNWTTTTTELYDKVPGRTESVFYTDIRYLCFYANRKSTMSTWTLIQVMKTLKKQQLQVRDRFLILGALETASMAEFNRTYSFLQHLENELKMDQDTTIWLAGWEQPFHKNATWVDLNDHLCEQRRTLFDTRDVYFNAAVEWAKENAKKESERKEGEGKAKLEELFIQIQELQNNITVLEKKKKKLQHSIKQILGPLSTSTQATMKTA